MDTAVRQARRAESSRSILSRDLPRPGYHCGQLCQLLSNSRKGLQMLAPYGALIPDGHGATAPKSGGEAGCWLRRI